MRLELQRNMDGSGLMILVVTEQRSIAIPLAHGVSVEIDKMLLVEKMAKRGLLTEPARRVELSKAR